MLSSRLHGYMDYPILLIAILSPWMFGFSEHTTATMIPVLLGIGGLIYAVMTDYEASLTRQIPMRVHIGLDMAAGAFLALSPWLFGFANYVFWPHLLLGLIEIGAALVTVRQRATIVWLITNGLGRGNWTRIW
jgi:hypothetical protein